MFAHAPQITATASNFDYSAKLDHQSQNRPKGERTCARIQIAACNCLQRHGPQDVTVSTLCQEAGIAHGTFYLHFPDRNLLLAETLLGFVTFLQDGMRAASSLQQADTLRASSTAYANMFKHNAGLMNCLIHHHATFPEAQEAFHKLNNEWIGTVVASERKRLCRQGHAKDVLQDELLCRAYALGSMVDQYLSGLYLSVDPALIAVSIRQQDVINTLCLIWERGMEA